VLGCNQFVTRPMYAATLPAGEDLSRLPEIACRGGSAILSPLGDILAAPLYDEEGVLLVELDMTEIPRSRFDFDVTGHYARPDVFQLSTFPSIRGSQMARSINDPSGGRFAPGVLRTQMRIPTPICWAHYLA
jgi:hypothetical protein